MRTTLALSLILLLAVTLVSCGKDDNDKVTEPGNGGTDPGDSERPTVVTSSPGDSATGRTLLQPVTFTFSESMEPSTITDTTLFAVGQTPVLHVQYDEPSRTATLTPDSLLYAPQTWHTIVVTEGATDLAGNPAWPETLAFQTGAMNCDNVADLLEPNEEIAEAALVDLGSDYYSLTACGDGKDTYKFNVDETARITVSTFIRHAPLDTSGNGPCWQIYFMRANGEYYSTLGTRAAPGQTQQFAFSFNPGTYYCEIFPYYELDPDEYILYDLEVAASEACGDDVYEDNDFADEAAPITAGIHTDLKGCYLDADYYSIGMTNGQTLTVTLDATFQTGDWEHRRMHVAPPAGDSFYYSGLDNPLVGQVTATTDGTATFYVMFWEDDVEYSLNIELVD